MIGWYTLEVSADLTSHVDVNAIVGSYLRDLAFAQPTKPQMFGYKRAAAVILSLETSLTELVARESGALPKIVGIGPGSARVITEVLATGESATVERAVDASGRRAEIERRRALRSHFLSRAEVVRILSDEALNGPRSGELRCDLQMHSEWSDGTPTVEEIGDACRARGYTHAALTDHSYGLKIAGGMSMEEAHEQRRAIDRVNAANGGSFRLLQGVEANIDADGNLDLSAEDAEFFDVVLAAPHSRLRKTDDQTARMINAVENPAVRVLAHPRGRITGSRPGVLAEWKSVFAVAAKLAVAIEIDGDPSRQDVDYTMARDALAAGCLFALDSDAHATDQLVYSETALAHARLAGIPSDRIVTCWPLERFVAWLSHPQGERKD